MHARGAAHALGFVLGLALVGGGLGAVACGEKAGALAPSQAGAGDSGVESFAEINPADLEELDGGKAQDRSRGAAAAGNAGASAEPIDECAPVGVDFEKRVRPKIKQCYAAGKKKTPDLQGSVKIALEIDMLAKVKGVKIVEATLPDAVAQCMLKAVKNTPLPDAAKCPGKSLTIPVTFPTPR